MRRALVGVLAVGLLLCACGSDEDDDATGVAPAAPATTSGPDSPTSAEAPAGTDVETEPPGASVTVPASTVAGPTKLAIGVWELGRDGGPAQRYTLTCDPVGGDLPEPERACTVLAAGSAEFEPIPPDTICTAIFGGPAVATVSGTVLGEPLEAEFTRENGCQISRWDTATALLPADLSGWQEQDGQPATTG